MTTIDKIDKENWNESADQADMSKAYTKRIKNNSKRFATGVEQWLGNWPENTNTTVDYSGYNRLVQETSTWRNS